MKLSESVVEAFGENDKVEDLSNELAKKIKIISELKDSSINANNRSITENVDKSIEETFRDKSIAKSFGEITKEEDFNDTDPETPHKRKALRADSSLSSDMMTEDTMTLSSSSITEMPAKRQRTENPDLPSTCQVNIV